MDIEIVRRVALARHLFQLASDSLRSGNDMQLFVAVNLMQDATEAFLVGICDYLQVHVDQNTKFDKLISGIEGALGRPLPLKNSLLRINRARIDAKHHGIQPAREECERFKVLLAEFFADLTRDVINSNFWTVSAVDFLPDNEAKSFLQLARDQLEEKSPLEAGISCRKAIYLMIEKDYSVFEFRRDSQVGSGLFGPFSRAPSYAQNARYIDEHVKSPVDYIVLDHQRVDSKLLKAGIDPAEFWNVWRLTPKLFRKPDKSWVVLEDFDVQNGLHNTETVEYVFSAVSNIALAFERQRQRTRSGSSSHYRVRMKSSDYKVYDRADLQSRHVIAPPQAAELSASYRTQSLQGDSVFWHVVYIGKGEVFTGFVRDEDVDHESLAAITEWRPMHQEAPQPNQE